MIRYIINREWYTITLDLTDKNSAATTFRVYEVTCRTDEDTPQLSYRDNKTQQDTDDFTKAEPIVSGYLKWDGCIDFNAHLHMCGYNTLIQDIIKDLYLEASKVIEFFDEECANFDKIK